MKAEAKGGAGTVEDQLQALLELRKEVVGRIESEQNWLRLDIELEKFAFVLLSQVANDLEHQRGEANEAWWQRLLKAFHLALSQVQLSGLSPEECDPILHEVSGRWGLSLAI